MFNLEKVNIKNKAGNLIFTNLITLSIQKGEIWMIKGSNGIGKSSIYEAFFGIRPIEEGKIFFNDIQINTLSPEKRVDLGIKYIAQTNSLFESLSIKDNLTLCAEFLLPKNQREEIIEEVIETCELKALENNKIYQLSGGQKRLAEVAKILIGPTKFILLDEPFAAIDEYTIKLLQTIFMKLKFEKEISFLINDHNLSAVTAISDYSISITKKNTNITKLQKNDFQKTLEMKD